MYNNYSKLFKKQMIESRENMYGHLREKTFICSGTLGLFLMDIIGFLIKN